MYGMSRDEAKSFAELLCLTYARYPTAATCQETWSDYPEASYHTLPAEPQGEAAEAFGGAQSALLLLLPAPPPTADESGSGSKAAEA